MKDEKQQALAEKVLDVSEVLSEIEPEKREIIAGAMVAMESYSGPLPSPEDFKAYKDVLDSAPERILAMAERQQEHRMAVEKRLLDIDARESHRGQVTGAVLVVLCVGAAVLLGLTGHDWLAGAVVAITAAVATIFVLHKEPKE